MPADAEPIETGVLLGSGLSSVGDPFEAERVIRFDEIPGVGDASVAGHRGEVRTVRIGGRACCFVFGRRHYYEGDGAPIGRLIEHLHETGVRQLVVTSAAGSLDASAPPGELVLVDTVLDLQFRNRRTEARSTDSGISRAARGHLVLADALRARIESAAGKAGLRLNRASLASLAGPSYETPSEILALKSIGASLVSMSGAPETVAANALGIQVAIIAVVTNWAAGISTVPLAHDEVLARGEAVASDLRRLIAQFVELDQVKRRR